MTEKKTTKIPLKQKPMARKTAIKILTEFNRWRRAEGEYEWKDNPDENKPLEYTASQIGKALDFAINFMSKADVK